MSAERKLGEAEAVPVALPLPKYEIRTNDTKNDPEMLKDKEGWLCDMHINWGRAHSIKQYGMQGSVYAMDTMMVGPLLEDVGVLSSKHAERIRKAVMTLIPVQESAKGAVHWSLIIAVRVVVNVRLSPGKSPKVIHFRAVVHADSLPGMHKKAVQKIADKLRAIGDMPVVIFDEKDVPVARQDNGSDCGVFTIEFARRAVQWLSGIETLKAAGGVPHGVLSKALVRNKLLETGYDGVTMRKEWHKRILEYVGDVEDVDDDGRPISKPKRTRVKGGVIVIEGGATTLGQLLSNMSLM